jgi:AcrR family transcriptional regulator
VSPLSRMSADARREQLVSAAIEVMSARGLGHASTRAIASHARAPQAAIHYAFRDKNELLAAVIAEVGTEVERVLRAAVDPGKGLIAAVRDGVNAYWEHVAGDDGLQLLQYELTIFSLRTPGYEWLAQAQYARYTAIVEQILRSALGREADPPAVDVAALSRLLVAVVDGLIIQYEVHHDAAQARADLDVAIRGATLMARQGGVR